MVDNENTDKCVVCDDPISEHEHVEIICRHTEPTTTETIRTLTEDSNEHRSESDGDTEELSDRQRELIDELHRVAGIVNHSPSISEMNKISKCNGIEYWREFGGWNNAKEIAGLETYGNGGGPNTSSESDPVIADGGNVEESEEQQTFFDLSG